MFSYAKAYTVYHMNYGKLFIIKIKIDLATFGICLFFTQCK